MVIPPELRRFVRQVRRSAGSDLLGARSVLFSQLLLSALPEPAHSLIHASGDFPGNEVPLHGRAGSVWTPSEKLLEDVRAEPLLIGWAYQIWNEPERSISTWAVSRRAEAQSERLQLSPATQLFTEGYMATFLVERLHRVGGLRGSVCDPACGTGHILIHVARAIRRDASHSSAESIVAKLYGFDVDPFAVTLCRWLLLVELLRGGGEVDCERCLPFLTERVRTVPAPLGTLDRSSPEALLHRQYDCVITNPPYLGRRKLTAAMRDLLDREYPACAADLCTAFIERCLELLSPRGWVGLVTHDKWLRLRGYRSVRNGGGGFSGLYRVLSLDALVELGERAFDRSLGLHDGVGVLLLTGQKISPPSGHRCLLRSLSHEKEYSAKAALLAVVGASGDDGKDVLQELLMAEEHEALFMERAGIPDALVRARRRIAECADVVVGLQTDDDQRFVRFHWEVAPDHARWRVHAKGGGYGRWFGLNRTVIDWEEGLRCFGRSSRAGLSAQPWFERSGWVYSWFANGSLGLRFKDAGSTFGRAAATGLFTDDARLIAFLNSQFSSLCCRRIGGKVQLPEGVVRRLPVPPTLDPVDPKLVWLAVELKRWLTRNEPTDITFVPRESITTLGEWAVEALLRTVEGRLHLQVCEALGVGVEEAGDAAPVGMLPTSYNLAHDDFWGLIPAQYQYLREEVLLLLPHLRVVEASPAVSDEQLMEVVMQPRRETSGSFVLPPDGPVERLSMVLTRNPIELVGRLAALTKRDPQLKWTLESRALDRELFVQLVSELGHVWWSESERDSEALRGESSFRDLTLALEASAAGEQLLLHGAMSVRQWLSQRAERWQRAVFGTRGIVTFDAREERVVHRSRLDVQPVSLRPQEQHGAV